MPTSFEALHEETRPLALLDRPAGKRPRTGGGGVCCISALLVVLLVLL